MDICRNGVGGLIYLFILSLFGKLDTCSTQCVNFLLLCNRSPQTELNWHLSSQKSSWVCLGSLLQPKSEWWLAGWLCFPLDSGSSSKLIPVMSRIQFLVFVGLESTIPSLPSAEAHSSIERQPPFLTKWSPPFSGRQQCVEAFLCFDSLSFFCYQPENTLYF